MKRYYKQYVGGGGAAYAVMPHGGSVPDTFPGVGAKSTVGESRFSFRLSRVQAPPRPRRYELRAPPFCMCFPAPPCATSLSRHMATWEDRQLSCVSCFHFSAEWSSLRDVPCCSEWVFSGAASLCGPDANVAPASIV